VSVKASRIRCLLNPLVLLWTMLIGASAQALQPDQILLITNKNSGDSQKLAELYSQLRGIPADHTVALDVRDVEDIPFGDYETHVVAPVRQFLFEHHLQSQITCLVTFWGVPFRISAKVNSPQEKQELADLRQQEAQLLADGQKAVEALEKQAIQLDPSFKPAANNSIQVLDARMRAAVDDINPRINLIADPDQKAQALTFITKLMEPLGSPSAEQLHTQTQAQWQQRMAQGVNQIHALQNLRWDPQARAQLRELSRQYLGKLGAAQIVAQQISYFATEHTDAATDSELSLLWWNYYPRQNWLANPLHYSFPAGAAPPALMVMRLDGPDIATVEKLMRTSVAVEKTGLQGIVALDARGLPPIGAGGKPDPFGEFDEHIRQLGLFLHQKTDLKIKLDDNEPVFAAHSVQNVALYVGWYRLNQYLPGCDFNPGAVGYHVASYEMVHYRGSSPTGWVHGLLSDGVVGTLGPVAEPYLLAFPNPQDFFPLLLTGKLTLAEVYWKTAPTASWMIGFIGDPLYTPYKINAPMKADDLPPQLRRALAPTSRDSQSPPDAASPGTSAPATGP
jgi:uncharacterized protein (TIGR03790 family)